MEFYSYIYIYTFSAYVFAQYGLLWDYVLNKPTCLIQIHEVSVTNVHQDHVLWQEFLTVSL